MSQQALMLRDDGSIVGPCTMLDVSASGARLKIAAGIETPPEFTLLLSKVNAAMRRRCVVAWRKEGYLGIRFLPS